MQLLKNILFFNFFAPSLANARPNGRGAGVRAVGGKPDGAIMVVEHHHDDHDDHDHHEDHDHHDDHDGRANGKPDSKPDGCMECTTVLSSYTVGFSLVDIKMRKKLSDNILPLCYGEQ